MLWSGMPNEDPRETLAVLAEARGDSLAALSAMLGRNAAYLQQFVKRGSPRRLAEGDRRTLAQYFGVAEAILGGDTVEAAGFCIARLAVRASAGPGTLVDDEVVVGTDVIDRALARRLGLRDGKAVIIRVRGSSMEPGFRDGDHIVVDTADRAPRSRGAPYVVRIGDLVMVKRVATSRGTLTVTSDNPAADAVPAGDVVVIGRVVWQMREPD